MLAGALFAMFSAATMDSGRLLGPLESLDDGRCCQESVPERPRDIEALGDDLCDGDFNWPLGDSAVLPSGFVPIVEPSRLPVLVSETGSPGRGEGKNSTGGSVACFDIVGV